MRIGRSYIEPDGSIMNGDDHKWSGDPSLLTDGGWHGLKSESTIKKRACPEEGSVRVVEDIENTPKCVCTLEVIDLTYSSPNPPVDVDSRSRSLQFDSSSVIDYGSGDEREVSSELSVQIVTY